MSTDKKAIKRIFKNKLVQVMEDFVKKNSKNVNEKKLKKALKLAGSAITKAVSKSLTDTDEKLAFKDKKNTEKQQTKSLSPLNKPTLNFVKKTVNPTTSEAPKESTASVSVPKTRVLPSKKKVTPKRATPVAIKTQDIEQNSTTVKPQVSK